MKTCGVIDGVPVQCPGDTSLAKTLADAPEASGAVSSDVVFENKFIDIFANVEADVREVSLALMMRQFIVLIGELQQVGHQESDMIRSCVFRGRLCPPE